MNTDYGKWQWKSDNSGFRFDPDAEAVNRLRDEKVSTTLNVRIVDASTRSQEHLGSIAVIITGTGAVELSISTVGAVTESDGAAAVFTVTSAVNPEGTIEVNYTPVETGNFLRPPDATDPSVIGHISGTMTSATMQFAERPENSDGYGSFSYRLAIPLNNNAESDSTFHSVTVTLNPDTSGRDYRVSAANSSAVVTIIDDETLPVLTFEETDNPTEFSEDDQSGAISFKISATSMPPDANPETERVEIDVRYTVSQTGDFIDSSQITPDEATSTQLNFYESGGKVRADLSIPISNDRVGEPTGSVRVTLMAADTPLYFYKLGTDAERNSHEVKVYDDDVPELTVSIGGDAQFIEGEAVNAEFTVESRFNVNASLSVDFNVWESVPTDPVTALTPHVFAGAFSSPATLDFRTSKTQTIRVPINDIAHLEPDRYVNVTLSTGTGYTAADADEGGSARILVVVDDKPELSITAASAVTEATMAVAEFTVTSPTDPGGPVEVGYTPTEAGSFLAPAPATGRGHTNNTRVDAMMTFTDRSPAQDGSGPFEATLAIPLLDNATPNSATQSVTVTLNADKEGADYVVSTTNTSATMIIIDDETLPVLTFEASENSAEYVEPGSADTLEFYISASAMPQDAYPDTPNAVEIDVHYIPTQTGSFIDTDNFDVGSVKSAKLTFEEEEYISVSGPTQGQIITTITAELSIPLEADNEGEPSGSVTVTLMNADTSLYFYRLGTDTQKNSHTVKMFDDDFPELSISIDELQFAEGASATVDFAVTASIDVANDLMVEFRAWESDPSDPDTELDAIFLGSNSSPATMNFSNSFSSPSLSIAIVDDNVADEPARYVNAVLNAGTGYTVAVNGNSARILVVEGAKPVLSIRGGSTVNEADDAVAKFTVTSDVDPGSSIDVSYTPAESGNFLHPSPSTGKAHTHNTRTEISMAFTDRSDSQDGTGPFTYELEIPLRNNTDPNLGNQSVTVTLNTDTSGTDYVVAATGSSASVTVIDDETIPILTLEESNNPAEFVEPAAAAALTFKVTASAMPIDAYPATNGIVEIDVRYTLSQTGGFIDTTNITLDAATTAKLAFTENNGIATADLAIPIAADNVGEPTGSVVVTLLGIETSAETSAFYYKLGTDPAKNSHRVTVFDDDSRGLSVSIDREEFIEGEAASIQFTFAARSTFTGFVNVNYTVWESDPTSPDTASNPHVYIGSNTGSARLDFSTLKTQPLSISITDDEARDEPDRYVNVTLNSGTGYIPAAENAGRDARILVVDDDVTPELSISGGGTVTESDYAVARFTVTADVDPRVPTIAVGYTPSETGNFLDSSTATGNPHTANTRIDASMAFQDRSPAGDGSGPFTYELEIPLINNTDTDSATQSVTVTLNSDTVGTDYTVSTANSSASVTIIDDESLPVLSLEANNNPAEFNENDPAGAITFRITAAAMPMDAYPDTAGDVNIDVRYTLSQTGDFIDRSGGLVPNSPKTSKLTFTDSNGAITAAISIPIAADEAVEPAGQVGIVLLDAGTLLHYYKLGTDPAKNSHIVTVHDGDGAVIPVVPELSISGGGAVTESAGAVALFTVISNVDPGTSISVNYTPTETGSFLDPSPATGTGHVNGVESTAMLTFEDRSQAKDGTGPFTAPLGIPLQDNSFDEPGAQSVTVTLNAAANIADYSVSEENYSASVTVIDDETLPVLTLEESSNLSEFNEPETTGSIIFKVTAAFMPMDAYPDTANAVEIDVRYTPSQTGDFLDATTITPDAATTSKLTFVESNGTITADLSIPVAGDSLGEPTGSVSVTLLETGTVGYYYKLGTDPAKNSHAVKVFDNSNPELTISIGSDPFVEGSATVVRFTVSASLNYTGSLTVNYTVWESDPTAPDTELTPNVFASETSGTATLEFADSNTQHLDITIEDDETEDGDDRYVNVRLDDGTGYFAAGANSGGSASVLVVDDEGAVRISLSAPDSVLESDGTIEFTVSALWSPESVLDIDFALSERGEDDYLNVEEEGRTSASLTLEDADSDGTYTANISVMLTSDDIGEATGEITLTLEEKTDVYRLNQSAKTATVKIYDDDAPLIWIEAVNARVLAVEGAKVSYTLSSRVQTMAPVRYEIGVSKYLDFTSSQVRTTTGAFTAAGVSGEFEQQIDIPLSDYNALSNAPDSVTVRLLPDANTANPGYMTATNDQTFPDSASVQITAPVVAGIPFANITSSKNSVKEGEEIVFSISITPEQSQDVRVNLRVSQQGNFIPWPIPDSVLVPPAGKMLKIPTIDNDEVEDGFVKVEVLRGEGYRPGTDKSVSVTDNGAQITKYSVAANVITMILSEIPPTSPQGEGSVGKPTLSISAVKATVVEGESAVFAISTSHAVDRRISIKIKLNQSGDFVLGPMNRSVDLKVESLAAELVVATDDDGLAEADGRITATIMGGNEYHAASNNHAAVAVSDAKDRDVRQNQLQVAGRAVLAELTGTIGSQSLATGSQRITQSLAGNTGNAFSLGGNSSLQGYVEAIGDSANNGMEEWQEILGNSAFTLDLFPEQGQAESSSIWGMGDNRKLTGGNSNLNGELFTGHIGFDTKPVSGLVTGVAASIWQSETDYAAGDVSVSYETRSNGLQGYFGLESATGNSELHFVTGYGLGEVEMDQIGYDSESLGTSTYNVGLSGSSQLYSYESLLGGTSTISATVDSWHAGQFLENRGGFMEGLTSKAGYARIALEGSHEYETGGNGRLSPNTSIGLRADAKNQQTFIGMEFGVGLAYENPFGLTLASDSVIVATNGGQLREVEIAGSVDFDRYHDGRGVLLEFAPTWGQTFSESDSPLWNDSLLSNGSELGVEGTGRKIDAEIGYGLHIWDGTGLLMPNVGVSLTDAQGDAFRLGSRLNIGPDLEIEITGERNYNEAGSAKNKAKLEGRLKW